LTELGLYRRQFVRFVLVGGINTLFSYLVYAALLYLGLPYVAANFGAMLLGVMFSFRTQGWLVFGNTSGRLIFRFAACWCLIFLVNIAIIWSLIRLGLNAYLSGAFALLPVTVISYLVQRFLVFRAPQSPRD
jgi:putative flippase GtrA